MEKILEIGMYFSWALWLIYSFVTLFREKNRPDKRLFLVTGLALIILLVLLKSRMMIVFSIIALLVILVGMFRKSSTETAAQSPAHTTTSHSPFFAFFGLLLATFVLLALFTLLTGNFKSESGFFIEKYDYRVNPGQKEIIIGTAKAASDITIQNRYAAKIHMKIFLGEKNCSAQNISEHKRIDLDGLYLNKLVLRRGDEIELEGREKIRILDFHHQYPLGRALSIAVYSRKAGERGVTEKRFTLHTFLNKTFLIMFDDVPAPQTAFNKLLLPGRSNPGEPVAAISYETGRTFLGMNIYYLVVFFTILLLSIGIYLYLKNRFNGALLLLMMLSLPFMAGVVRPLQQLLLILVFLPIIAVIQKLRNPGIHWGSILLVILFAFILILPSMLRMSGEFNFSYYDTPDQYTIRVNRGKGSFRLQDLRKQLEYENSHRVILGHTGYDLTITRERISLVPKDPEKISFSPDFRAVISDLAQAEAGRNYVYLEFPHEFDPVPAASAAGKERLLITGKDGSSITLSKIVNENYDYYFNGLIFLIILPFWLFLFLNYYGIPLRSPGQWLFKMRLFTRSSVLVYNLVYFLLGLGYVVFGALALYNNNYFKNFQKYRQGALPLFVVLFFLLLILSKYNRLPVFLYRALKKKKFHVPLLTGLFLIFLVNYGRVFLVLGILFFIIVFAIRLRKDIKVEYRNAGGSPIDLKRIIETPIASFEDPANQKILFGLGRVLNNRGWNYITISDMLLVFALFFIVLQIFLGSELGVSVAGFFFLPIELGKIMLTIFFADWVSRIDKGLRLNVLWIYSLVLVPFLLLIIFLKDFSPLLVFAFVFFYHIIKINKPLKFKLFLLALIAGLVVLVVTALSTYTFPFKILAVMVSLVILFFIARLLLRKKTGQTKQGRIRVPIRKILGIAFLLFLLVGMNYIVFFHHIPVPVTLGSRVESWLHPWQDYNLSYQYINSLWLMKGAGTFGKGTEALVSAGQVPLIEKDLSFSLYIGVLGTLGTAFIFFTLLILLAYVHQLSRGAGTVGRWQTYLLEFLVVIFLAQFLVPALYVTGLLPIMGQPLPFLAYSNNILLLFALPFAFLMIAAAGKEETELR